MTDRINQSCINSRCSGDDSVLSHASEVRAHIAFLAETRTLTSATQNPLQNRSTRNVAQLITSTKLRDKENGYCYRFSSCAPILREIQTNVHMTFPGPSNMVFSGAQTRAKTECITPQKTYNISNCAVRWVSLICKYIQEAKSPQKPKITVLDQNENVEEVLNGKRWIKVVNRHQHTHKNGAVKSMVMLFPICRTYLWPKAILIYVWNKKCPLNSSLMRKLDEECK